MELMNKRYSKLGRRGEMSFTIAVDIQFVRQSAIITPKK